MKRFLLYLLFLLTSLNLTGQVVYPIRANTVLSQPLPYSLSGFVSEPGKMTLNIFVDDIKLDQYAVKFRVNFEGNGIKISTRPNLYQEPYYVDGGMTHSLTGFELENLMDPDNLIFEGYSRQQYKKDDRLPDGVYRVWIDVIDYYRNVKVAMSTPSIGMIYMAKAPRLSFPVDKSEIDPVLMPSIRFSWFSILPVDPLADIAYRFKLYEIRIAGRDPYEVVNVRQPIFQEEVNHSNFTYDLGMPPLMPGHWYVWRVEAFDRENRVKFQNDGYSDVLTFRYGQSCKLPELRINSVEHHDVTLAWQPEMNTKDYLIAYKKAKDDQWFEKGTSLSQLKIEGLDDNTGYQVKIKSLCGDEETEFSRIHEFKTPREINYACGKKGNTYDLSNSDPMPTLGRFDEFKAADFIVEVEEAEGGNGNFTGNGYALVPYIGFIKFKVSFENIFVNIDGRMTSGEIKFVYDEATGLIVGGNNGSEDDEVEEINVVEELDKISDQVIESEKELEDVVIVGDNVVITYGDGSTKEVQVEEGKKIAIVGGGTGGNAYVADSGTGQVFKTPKKVSGEGKGSSSVGTAAQTGEFGCGIQFSQAKNQRFGFDLVGNGKNKPNSYFKTSKTGEKLPWKSLQSGSSDVLDLTVTGTCSADSLRYIRNSGLLTPSIAQGEKRQLLLTGLSEGEEDILTVARLKTEITGYSNIADTIAKAEVVENSTDGNTTQGQGNLPTDTIVKGNPITREILTEVGALGLISYDRISRDVVLVPVNGAQCPQFDGIISKELNEIYASAVVDWHVSIEPNLEVDVIKGQEFEHSGTGKFSKYTSHMRQVIKAYKKEHQTDRQSLYLFFIEESTATKTGFMPLASEYGFIFNFRTDTHVLAHELGHGKDFNLRHTFSDKAQHYFPEKSTQNLMDYAGGSELWKYQWDLIHNPEKIFFSWAQDEEEGAMEPSVKLIAKRNDYIKDDKGYATFLAPSGMPISIKPTGDVDILVSAVEDYKFPVNGSSDTYIFSDLWIGTLISFTENTKSYTAAFTEDNLFLGYFDNKNEVYKYDNKSISLSVPYKINLINAKEEFYLFDSYYDLTNLTIDTYKAEGIAHDSKNYDKLILVPSLSNSRYDLLVEKLQERLDTQVTASRYVGCDDNLLADIERKDLEDRFYVYHRETGNSIFVDIVKINYKPSQDQIDQLAKDVYNKSSLKDDKNSMYVVLPIWNTLEINTKNLHSNDIARAKLSSFSKQQSLGNISHLVEYTTLSGTAFNRIKNLYKLVPKPHILYKYYLSYKGDLIAATPLKEGNSTDYDRIFDMSIHYDERMDGVVKGIVAGSFEGNNSWIAYELIEGYSSRTGNVEHVTTDMFGLKEARIKSTHQEMALWFTWYKFNIWSEGFNIQEIPSPSEEAFLLGRNEYKHQSTLNKIDAASIALSTSGLDFIPDAIGAVYCITSGDAENAVIYTAATLPLITGGSIKLTKKVLEEIADGQRFVYKLGDVLMVLSPQDIKTIKSLKKNAPLLSNNEILKFYDEIRKYDNVAKNLTPQLAELLVKAGQGKTQVLSRLSGWSTESLNALSKDLKSNANFAKAFFDEVAAKPELVEAWKVVSDLPESIRKSFSVEEFAKIRKYLDDSGETIESLQKRIPANKDFAKVWIDNLHRFGKQIGKKGDYIVEEAGEVFYRAIPKDHYEELLKGKKLLKSDEWKAKGLTIIGGEGSTSPKLAFSTDYDGVLVKYYLKKGTIDKFVDIGVMNNKKLLIKKYYGDMPTSKEYKELTGEKWTINRVQFKLESNPKNPDQVNIQLGKDKGIDIFNENLITIEIISTK